MESWVSPGVWTRWQWEISTFAPLIEPRSPGPLTFYLVSILTELSDTPHICIYPTFNYYKVIDKYRWILNIAVHFNQTSRHIETCMETMINMGLDRRYPDWGSSPDPPDWEILLLLVATYTCLVSMVLQKYRWMYTVDFTFATYSVAALAQSYSVPVRSHVCSSDTVLRRLSIWIQQSVTLYDHLILIMDLLCFISILLCPCVSPSSTDITATAHFPQCRLQ